MAVRDSDGHDIPAADGPGHPPSAYHVSRRSVLTQFGTAAAIGATFAGSGAVTPDRAVADDGHQVGIAAAETTAIESLTRIEQNGDALTGFGYLTSVAGLDATDLFLNSTRSESSARFTAFGTATVTGRSILGTVFSIDAEGQLTVYFHSAGGADFSHPDSFRNGHVVAVYDVVYQCVNTVIATNTGVFKLAGDFRQRQAEDFQLAGRRRRFGRPNVRLRMEGNGSGIHDAPRASLVIASNFVVIG
jgi:hypothetical protein